jgi:hypothetical protein
MRYLWIILILISCSNNRQTNDSGQRDQFREFINRQNIIKLPTKIDLYEDYDGLVKPEISDTSILHEKTQMWYLGLLEDTSRFYYVIPMYPGDDLCPLLYVFSKNGDLIDKSSLLVGNYGPDCGAYVYGYTKINKDLSIFTQDSLAAYNCDSIGKENRDSLTIYLKSQKMRVLSNGKVEQDKAIERIIKK